MPSPCGWLALQMPPWVLTYTEIYLLEACVALHTYNENDGDKPDFRLRRHLTQWCNMGVVRIP